MLSRSNGAFHVLWRVHPELDLIQASSFLDGLAELARHGIVSLSVEYAEDRLTYPAALDFRFTEPGTGTTMDVFVDFGDSEERIDHAALSRTDLYFKRQCGPGTRLAARPEAAKVRPLGLTIAGFTRASWRLLIPALRGPLRNRPIGAALRAALDDLRLWLRLPSPASVVSQPSDTRSPAIVFQPRLWRADPDPGRVFSIANEDRMATIRALRRAFPGMRAIGLTHNAAGAMAESDLLLDEKVTTREYHRQLRTSSIGINCNGLAGSLGWKLAEYLAAGCAVVSQPISKELPQPLVEGVHYLSYNSADECVAQCRRLLDDPAAAEAMGRRNAEYYRASVHPPEMVSRVIETAFVR